MLAHTGQHFDVNMSDVFFDGLGIRKPDHLLDIHGGTKLLQLKDACRAVGGSLTLLWHDSEFTDQEKKRLYQEVPVA